MRNILLIFAILCGTSWAATIPAASCSKANVQAAINSAVDGDVVTVPAGTCSDWTASVTISGKGITLQGNGATGGSQTIIQTNCRLTVTSDATANTRITGFHFLNCNGNSFEGYLGWNGTAGHPCGRIDHNAFDESGAGGNTQVTTSDNGQCILIDHNTIDGTGNPEEDFHIEGYGFGSNAGWTNDVTPGSPQAVYIESNTFTNHSTSFIESGVQVYYGARVVERNNTMNYMQFDVHGTAGNVGGRWYEIYNNNFNDLGQNMGNVWRIRGGSGVVFGNRKTNTGSGQMNGAFLEDDTTGTWPLAYQVGSGINGTTNAHNSCAGPFNSSPAYAWDNGTISVGGDGNYVQSGRDVLISASQPASLRRQQQAGDTCSTTYSYTPFTNPFPLDANGFPNPSVPPATMIVNNSGSPACSDTAGQAGTLAAPFCTISYGLSRLAGGSTLYVRSGTYAQFTATGPSGNIGTPTTIAVYPGDTVTINGGDINNGRVRFNTVSNFVFDGFKITQLNQGLFCDTCVNATLQNLEIFTIGQEGLHIHVNSLNVTVNNVNVHDTGQLPAQNGEGIYIGTGSNGPLDNTGNVTVNGCQVTNTTNEGIDIKEGTHDVTINGCTLTSIGRLNNGFGGAAIEIHESVSGVQTWPTNPNHVVKNTFIAGFGVTGGGVSLNSGIRVGTGATVYNMVIYGGVSGGDGIYTDNNASDSYTRKIYNNTVDASSATAIVNSGGTVDIKNNIGPSTTNNLAINSAYFVGYNTHDYRLAAGSAPIGAGVNLLSAVPTDITGAVRTLPMDIGAYKFVGQQIPAPSPGLFAKVF